MKENDLKIKILLHQNKQFGDVLLSTPLIRAIKQTLPNAEIHFFTEPITVWALTANPNIHTLHVIYPKSSLWSKIKLYLKLRKLKFDAVFDLRSTPKATFETIFIHGKIAIGSKKRYLGMFYTTYVHNSENPYSYNGTYKLLFLEKLLSLLGKEELKKPSLLDYSQESEIFLTPEEKQFVDNFCTKYDFSGIPTIALNVVSRRAYKIWDPKNYAEVIVYLLKKKKRLFFWHGPGEIHLVQKVLDFLPEHYKKDTNLFYNYEYLTLRQLFGVFAQCQLYIGNDGGPKHIACASGIPTITIFKSDFYRNWTLVNDSQHKTFDSQTHSVQDILSHLEAVI